MVSTSDFEAAPNCSIEGECGPSMEMPSKFINHSTHGFLSFHRLELRINLIPRLWAELKALIPEVEINLENSLHSPFQPAASLFRSFRGSSFCTFLTVFTVDASEFESVQLQDANL
ncbi:hypothetical protein POTOM_048211 [Populus tomentosa]|uniref:Uncharacterized protein n=1 Tax=Populus tomentosa TaxID=118781 RepID=A0A8X8CAD0_POPTO|nr:hypothetical protein POTOM_048211 [Populus tomentosa]